MTIYNLILTNAAIVTIYMVMLWTVSLLKKDASIVDPYWGLGFVLIAWATVIQLGDFSFQSVLVLALVTVWGLRLWGYLSWRNWGEDEDRRYSQMREKHGDSFWWVSLFTVFLLQGVLLWFISLTIQSGIFHNHAGVLSLITWIGVVVWSVGFFFESVGDYQMARFKARPDSDGEVMNQGLWRFTRHPNYFGDFCIWWGLYLAVAPMDSWWTIGSPLLMSFLLLKVSGVSLLEGDIEERRPKYAEYKRRTNAFFPGPVSTAE